MAIFWLRSTTFLGLFTFSPLLAAGFLFQENFFTKKLFYHSTKVIIQDNLKQRTSHHKIQALGSQLKSCISEGIIPNKRNSFQQNCKCFTMDLRVTPKQLKLILNPGQLMVYYIYTYHFYLFQVQHVKDLNSYPRYHFTAGPPWINAGPEIGSRSQKENMYKLSNLQGCHKNKNKCTKSVQNFQQALNKY